MNGLHKKEKNGLEIRIFKLHNLNQGSGVKANQIYEFETTLSKHIYVFVAKLSPSSSFSWTEMVYILT